MMFKKTGLYGDREVPKMFCHQCGGKCNIPYVVIDNHRLCRRDCYDKYLAEKKDENPNLER